MARYKTTGARGNYMRRLACLRRTVNGLIVLGTAAALAVFMMYAFLRPTVEATQPQFTGVLTVEITGGNKPETKAKAAKIVKVSGARTTWIREPDESRDDFPATVVVDGVQEENPVELNAYDYGRDWDIEEEEEEEEERKQKHDEWYFHRWQWLENGQLRHEGPGHGKETLKVQVAGEMTREAVYLRQNGDIYDGGPRREIVPEGKEEKPGAFSVANLNDTNGNGTIDRDDPFVREEADLMQLVINRPEPDAAVDLLEGEGPRSVALGLAGDGWRLWKDSPEGAQEPAREFSVSQLPITLWLEGLQAGTVQIALDYRTARETLTATFVHIQSVHLVHSVGGGPWSENSTPPPVPYEAEVRLRAIIQVNPASKEKDQSGQDINKSYFWGGGENDPDPTQVTLANGAVWVFKWADSFWGKSPQENDPPGVRTGLGWTVQTYWRSVMPRMTHVELRGNDPADEGYLAYTNVTTVPPYQWLGPNGNNSGVNWEESGDYDVVEYETPQDNLGSGWQIVADASVGTRRYRIKDCYISGPGGVYSSGKEDGSTRCNLVYTGTDDAYDRGVTSTVFRISRLSDHPCNYIRHIEAYTQVPWILGSEGASTTQHQTERFVGFDCADLAVGAARKANLYGGGYTTANGLAGLRPARGNYGLLYLDQVVKRDSDGLPANVPIGTGENDLHIGDLIFKDYAPPDGAYDHTLVLYRDLGTAGTLDEGDEVIYASRLGQNGGLRVRPLSVVFDTSEHRFVLRIGWPNP